MFIKYISIIRDLRMAALTILYINAGLFAQEKTRGTEELTSITNVYELNKDGQFEYFVFDTDYNGYWDTVGEDTDGDGVPDEFDNYK